MKNSVILHTMVFYWLLYFDILQGWIEMTIALAYMSSALIGGVMYEVSRK